MKHHATPKAKKPRGDDETISPIARHVTHHLKKAARMAKEAIAAGGRKRPPPRDVIAHAKADEDALADAEVAFDHDTAAPAVDNAPCLPEPDAACPPGPPDAAPTSFGDQVRGFFRRHS